MRLLLLHTLLFAFIISISHESNGQDAVSVYSKGEQLYTEGQWNEAIDKFKKARESNLQTDNDSLYTISIYYSGICNYYLQQYNKALKNFINLHQIYSKKNRMDMIAFNHSNLGMTYMALKDLANSKKHYLISYQLSRDQNNLTQVAYNAYNIAMLYQYESNADSALLFYETCYNVAANIGLHQLASGSSQTMGDILWYLGKKKEAIQAYELSAEYDENTGLADNLAAKLNNLGLIYSDEGQHEKALKAYKKTLQHIDTLTISKDNSYIYFNLATVYDTLQKMNRAIYYYTKSINTDIQFHLDSLVRLKYITLAEAYKKTGNKEMQLQSYNNAFEIPVSNDLNNKVYLAENIANFYSNSASLDSAVHYYEYAIQNGDSIHSPDRYSTSLNNLAKVYYKQAKYKEAQQCYLRSIDINTTNNNFLGNSITFDNLGLLYTAKGNYEKALQCHKKALHIADSLGATDQQAIIMGNLGSLYNAQGKYEKAIDVLEKALKKDKQAGTNPANRFNNIALVYHSWGQFSKAIHYYDKAIDNGKETFANQVPEYYYNKSLSLIALDKYFEAEDLIMKTITMADSLGLQKSLPAYYNSLGMTYNSLGRYDEAIELYQKSLELAQKQNSMSDISVAYNNIGYVYSCWGANDKALEYYKKSITLDKENNFESFLSRKLNNIGGIYYNMDQYTKAEKYYMEALRLDRKDKRIADVCTDLNNLGSLYLATQKLDKALEHFNESLKIAQEENMISNEAIAMHNIGLYYSAKKENKEAEKHFLFALEKQKELNAKGEIANSYSNLASFYFGDKQYNKAIDYYKNAIQLNNEIRSNVPIKLKKEYLQKNIDAYRELALCAVIEEDLLLALNATEMVRSNTLIEEISGENEYNFNVESFYNHLDSNTAVIVFSQSNHDFISRIVITKEATYFYTLLIPEFIETYFNKHDEQKLSENLKKGFEKYINNKNDDYASVQSSIDLFGSIVKDYIHDLEVPYPDENTKSPLTAELLYQFLFEGMDTLMQTFNKTVISPDGILGLIPFETLRDNQSYLIENKDISYIQSLRMMEILNQRKYPDTRKELLAFGGAVYNSAEPVKVDSLQKRSSLARLSPDQVRAVKGLIYSKLEQSNNLSKEYKLLGYNEWSELEGSIEEVNAIQKLFSSSKIITGNDFNEDTIKSMANSGGLKDYKILHFSTHGVAFPEFPELSALVLTQDSKSNNDGYLRMSEIENLKFQADFVALSACETGLGKIYSGEGIIGLSQAFIKAGANSTAVSLWQVADKSTSVFMQEVYKKTIHENKSYSEAINEVKREFISGKYNKWWKSPFFWAPFVYFGTTN
ncbi:MAG: hypothetical protein C0594_14215 [Marinilabiliales bacterium]|nr:MAG: hypothetical protein C0594_14215 [Marinilabiliales bacterium]